MGVKSSHLKSPADPRLPRRPDSALSSPEIYESPHCPLIIQERMVDQDQKFHLSAGYVR